MTTPIEVRSFDVTTPPGVPSTAPQTTSIAMPTRVVTGIQLRIPPGPAGSVGVRILVSSTVVVPYQSSNWIVGDDDDIRWDLTGQPTTGAWSVQTYNTGMFQHTVYVRFLLAPVAGPSTLATIPIPTGQLDMVG